MSVFRNIFGGKKEPAAPSAQESMQQLRETEDMLMKKQEFLEKKISGEIATAKKHGTANKRLALQALKRKKNYEKQLTHIDGVMNTIQFQRESLENAATNAEVLQVMGSAAKAMKSAHKGLEVDQVHDLMEDIAEQQEVANEIAEAISNPVGFRSDIDEDDLLKELEELEEEDLNKQLLNVGPTPVDSISAKLPAAPTEDLPAAAKRTAKKQEDDDLAELEAWANA
uniref:Charged multivesicular body protein 4b n=1 Tax=Acrobeloides nanus TaxID=290746 RepID=A0A914CYZ7_9BILA